MFLLQSYPATQSALLLHFASFSLMLDVITHMQFDGLCEALRDKVSRDAVLNGVIGWGHLQGKGV